MIDPRPTRRAGAEVFGPCFLRVYEMAVAGERVDPALKTAARPLIEDFTAATPGHVGFVIYHRARPANFVLAHIWDGVDLIQRYWTAPLNDPTALVIHRAGAIGCLWELEVVAAERDAWAATCQMEDAERAYLDAPSSIDGIGSQMSKHGSVTRLTVASTARARLTTWTPDDFADLHELHADPAVMTFLRQGTPEPPEETRRRLDTYLREQESPGGRSGEWKISRAK